MTGRVVDEADEAPIPGAVVTAYRLPHRPPTPSYEILRARTSLAGDLDPDPRVPDTVVACTACDEEGRFRVQVPARTPCALIATAAGRVGSWTFVFEKSPSDRILYMADAGATKIRVVSQAGAPIQGAVILACGGSALYPPRVRSETDVRGETTVPLAPGETVRVQAKGYAIVHFVNALGRRQNPVVLPPAARIAGSVRDSTGAPLAGARVRVLQDRPHARPGEAAAHAVPTDADGRFVLDRLFPGRCSVHVAHEGYAPERAEIWPDEPNARFVLRRPASVEGVVVDESGQPVDEVTIRAHVSTASGPDGWFRLEDVPPGELGLHASVSQKGLISLLGQLDVRIEEGVDVTGLKLLLVKQPRSYVRYRVLGSGGAPLSSESTVRAFAAPAGTTVRFTVGGRNIQNEPGPLHAVVETITVDDPRKSEIVVRLPAPVDVWIVARASAPVVFQVSGECWIAERQANKIRVKAHPHDHFGVTAFAPGHATLRRFGLRADTDRIELELHRADCGLKGMLITQDGRPGAGLRVRGLVVGADGRFRVDGLPAGPVSLLVTDRGGARMRLEATLTPGRVFDLGTVRVPDPRRIRGLVLDPDGAPVWQARVRLKGPGRLAGRDDETRTRGDGSFVLDVAPFDELHLRIEKKGLATAFVSASETAPKVVLGRPGRARVTVTIPFAERSNQYGLMLTDAAGHTWVPRYRFRGRERTGYDLFELPAGRLRLWLNDHETFLDVVPGRTVEATLGPQPD